MRQPRVLIVEDQPLVALAISEAMEEVGLHPVGLARTLDEAMDLARNANIDLVALDIWLGNAASYPVATVLEKRAIPFVIIGAAAFAGDPTNVRRAPRLPKPFTREELLRTIRSLGFS